MTETLPLRRSDLIDDDIAVMTPEEARALQISWDARYSRDEVLTVARRRPRLSLVHRRTGGYLLASPWRHREEIANVLDIVGASTADDLLRAFIVRSSDLGFSLTVVAEYSERRRESFYYGAGMDVLEDIIIYELAGIPSSYARRPHHSSLEMTTISLGESYVSPELLDLDHRAFPWLWWNSEGEFRNYADVPGVSIEGARDHSGSLIGYIGTTALGSWGHLDRIAVDPGRQGEGVGRFLLDYAIWLLRGKGARRVALSTQSSNLVSRALYESTGFRRSRRNDYRIYGRWLVDPDDRPQLGTGEHV